MSPDRNDARLRDMLDYARQAAQAADGRRREDLDDDHVLRLALERSVEIIGEAANHVSAQRRQTLSGIPWEKIVGMRNRLVHGYGAVDRAILWDVVDKQLPGLIEQLEQALEDE